MLVTRGVRAWSIAILVALSGSCSNEGSVRAESGGLSAGTSPPPAVPVVVAEEPFTDEVVWIDEGRSRSLWRSPNEVLLIQPSAADVDSVKRIYPDSEDVDVGQRGVVVLRLMREADQTVLASIRSSHPKLVVSAVLHASSHPDSPRQGLTGGMIVRFREGRDETELKTWAAAKGWTLEEELVPGTRTYRVDLGDPDAVLPATFDLDSEVVVEEYSPDWWMETAH